MHVNININVTCWHCLRSWVLREEHTNRFLPEKGHLSYCQLACTVTVMVASHTPNILQRHNFTLAKESANNPLQWRQSVRDGVR